MKKQFKRFLRPMLFILAGALVGLLYYNVVGCASGTCPLTSSPYITMAYAGGIGGLLSIVFAGGERNKCNM